MATEAGERLQRYLARCGVASRRRAEDLISEGRVSVNGLVVTALGTKVGSSDVVKVDGRTLRPEQRRLYLLHKPPGVLSTMRDPHGRKTIADLTRHLPVRVFPVGRLDHDVSGLLLLTNDGDFAERLLHPRYGNVRRYWALVEGAPDDEVLERLRRGVPLDDGPARAGDASFVKDAKERERLFGASAAGGTVIELSVAEGRNHLVKRLLEAVGHPVSRLVRVAFGPYTLGALKRGAIAEIPLDPEKRGRGTASKGSSARRSKRSGGSAKRSQARGTRTGARGADRSETRRRAQKKSRP